MKLDRKKTINGLASVLAGLIMIFLITVVVALGIRFVRWLF